MKKQFFRMASFRHNAGKFVVTACIVVAGFAANAQTAQVKQEIKTIPVSVKFIGSQGDYLSFAVKYENIAGDKFDVVLRDHEGSILYRNSFTDKVFYKTFVLPKPDAGIVTFVIKNLRTNEVNSFEANTKVVEEMVVKTAG